MVISNNISNSLMFPFYGCRWGYLLYNVSNFIHYIGKKHTRLHLSINDSNCRISQVLINADILQNDAILLSGFYFPSTSYPYFFLYLSCEYNFHYHIPFFQGKRIISKTISLLKINASQNHIFSFQ